MNQSSTPEDHPLNTRGGICELIITGLAENEVVIARTAMVKQPDEVARYSTQKGTEQRKLGLQIRNRSSNTDLQV